MKLRYFTLLITMLIANVIHAQKNQYVITGQIVDAGSNHTIDYATVAVLDKDTKEIITGSTTENGGTFMLRVTKKEIYLEVSFIGYKTKTVETIIFDGNQANTGKIALGEDSQTLDEVVVTAAKSTTEFKLDKRVFNVGTDLSSAGASALEVLNNVPSVNVDIEGAVSLRGSTGVQILINGKPSILANDESNALGTITADMIESIEVITNPSAKYEAEGTAGILNIILKKNEKTGLNGSISLNTGAPHNHSVGLSLNRRTEKFNLFTQLGVGYRELPRESETTNSDFINDTKLYSIGEQYRNETFYNVILGSDFYINDSNVITLSGSFTYEVEDQPSETEFDLFQSSILTSEWTRTEITEADNPKLQYELQYTRDFKDFKDHKLLFSAIGNYFGKEQSSTFTNEYTYGSTDVENQITATNFNEGKYTFKLDYTKPFNDEWTLETGAQYLTNKVTNDYEVQNEIDGIFVIDPNLTNVFEYDQKVLGVYGTASYEGKVWGIKAGLRAENTDLATLLVNTQQDNSQNFTDFFPSLHTSYKVSERMSLQAGYSRRIYRPRLWDLNPFFNVRNNFSVRVGNPSLLPEYSDSYEIGSIWILDKSSFNLNVYQRFTTDKIERVSSFENGVNTYRPENIGTNRATGVEFNFKYSPSKSFTFNGDANYNVFSREGTFNDQVFDFSADQWSLKLTTKYKISKSIDAEVTTRYRSEEQTVQGNSSANLFADFGIRYKILKGKGVFNLSVRDVFASRIRESFVYDDDFFLYNLNARGRFITMGFSYGFGKGEAMSYSGGRRR